MWAGDTFTPSDVLKMLGVVEEAPDPLGANAWMMRPLFFAGLANARADAVNAGDGAGPFLFPITRGDMGRGVEKQLAGLPVFTSTQVSNTRAKGAASNLSYVIAGNFREAVIGRVGAIELAASEHAGFQADQLWLRAIIRTDFGLKHPASFVVSDQLVIPVWSSPGCGWPAANALGLRAPSGRATHRTAPGLGTCDPVPGPDAAFILCGLGAGRQRPEEGASRPSHSSLLAIAACRGTVGLPNDTKENRPVFPPLDSWELLRSLYRRASDHPSELSL